MSDLNQQAIYPSCELFLIRRFLQTQGIQGEQWLLGTGLREHDLKSADLKVSLQQFDIVYRNVYRLCSQPALGIELGKSLNLSRWGVLACALQSSKHLGDALNTAKEYRRLMRSRFQLIPETQAKFIAVNIIPHSEMGFAVSEDFTLDVLLGSLWRLMQDLSNTQASFEKVHLTRPAPLNKSLYSQLLQCPVYFGQKQNALYLTQESLLSPLPLANLASKRQALLLCETDKQLLELSFQQDTSALVLQTLFNSHHEEWKLPVVAKKLALSERSLRRKLHQQGKEFRELKQHRQMQLAIELLMQPLPVTQVAEQCGFKDSASFRQRFKDNMGMSPKQFQLDNAKIKLTLHT